MQIIKKLLSFILLLIILPVMIFYFWGSASNYNPVEYDKIIVYKANDIIAAKDTLSLLTFNIGYLSGMTNNLPVERTQKLYNNNLILANRLLFDLNPDFVGLQEIDFKSKRSFEVNQLEEIAVSGRFNYAAMAVNWDKKYVPFPYGWPNTHFGQVYSGQAILSKYKISENKLNVLDKPLDYPFYYNAFYLDRVAQVNKVDVNGTEIILINVHLEAWDIPTREKQTETLLSLYREYAKNYPVLLFGDFNSTPPNATHPYAIEQTMNTLLSEPGIRAAISDSLYLANEQTYFTYDSRNPSIKIDYILYNHHKIKAIDSRVVSEAREISDHLPVYLRFVIRK
jgi:endonuclease/exonuclease/phosphatase family metal-dependent hydrolase